MLNQIVGADLTTSDPQVDGIAASVLASPYRSGVRHGTLTVQACEGDDNCEVVFIYGIKGIPLDDAIRQGFDDTIASHANISVVAEGEGQYLGPDGGIKATQDILQITDSFDVMVGADQSIQGAAIVLADEGMAGKVKLIGLGGSEPAIDGVADGSWFGGVYGAPADEGRIAMEAMVCRLCPAWPSAHIIDMFAPRSQASDNLHCLNSDEPVADCASHNCSSLWRLSRYMQRLLFTKSL